MKTLLTISLAIIALNSFSSQAFAQCQGMFQDRIDFARHPLNGQDLDNREVGFKLTSNRADGRYVSYTEGSLKLRRDSNRNAIGFADPSQARQLFSDRKYSFEQLQGSTYLRGNRNVPFSILSPDALIVEVFRNPADSGASLLVHTVLASWGNNPENFIGQCHNNLIYGFNDTTQTIFTLSLFTVNAN